MLNDLTVFERRIGPNIVVKARHDVWASKIYENLLISQYLLDGRWRDKNVRHGAILGAARVRAPGLSPVDFQCLYHSRGRLFQNSVGVTQPVARWLAPFLSSNLP